MGKKQEDFVQSGRLNFSKNSNFDARLKLNRKQIDARQLLNKKQQKDHLKKFIVDKPRGESFISKSKKDPLVIVTGLGNVRKDSSGIRVVKPTEHRVISNGESTIVTVKNTRQENYTRDEEHRPSHSYHSNKSEKSSIQPIKIQFDNDLVRRRRDSPKRELFVNKTSKVYEEESMDYESEAPRLERSHSSSHSIDLHSNGYKLHVSNLHPKVTEDDILELFGDIGPIKRARFLDRGLAEVIYLKLEDAKEAIRKYDRNELDGLPMRIELVQSFSKYSIKDELKPRRSEPESTISRTDLSRDDYKNSISNRFKSVNAAKGGETTQFSLPEVKKTPEVRTSKIPVDPSVIHQVLFSKKSSTSNPVTFTVKL